MSKTLKIMISSTRADLAQYRNTALEIIEKLAKEKAEDVQLIPISMEEELQNGNGESAFDVSKRWVDESDWMILIVGWWYGTKSTNSQAEGKSLTEFEYSYAEKLKASDPNRKIFAFVSGNKGITEAYDAKDDVQNLLFSLIDIDEEDKKAIFNFRKTVLDRHATFFKNINDFSKKLRLTLQKNIENSVFENNSDLEPRPKPEFILRLIFELQTPIEKCISRVNRLETYKAIHDQLHEIRQKVIRRLREEILPKWEEEINSMGPEALSRQLERKLIARVTESRELQVEIKKTMKTISEKCPNFYEQLSIIVSTKLLSNDEDATPNFNDFSHNIDDLALLIQAAFSEANRLMARQAGLLDKFHTDLLEKINAQRITNKLTPEQNKQLDSELERIEIQRKQLFNVITVHDNWQTFHDALETVDLFKETPKFESRLKQFCNAHKIAFNTDINAELDRIKSENTDAQNTDSIEQLNSYWTQLNNSISIETYEAMRKEFDDIFYNLDKRTLKEVEKAGVCANEFKQLLEALRSQETK